MKANRFYVLLAATLSATAITCAPVDTPAPRESGPQPAPPPGPVAPLPPLPQERPDPLLRMRIEEAIRQTEQRDLETTNGFWTVFHGILGLGPDVTLVRPDKTRVNALDYIAGGGKLRGLRFVPTPFGLDVETRAGSFVSQGHQDQFIAEMVQWGVSPDRKFVVDGKDFTFRDFVNHSQKRASVKARQELEWALVIIGQHFGTDARWTNIAGEKLAFEDLLRAELDKPITAAACGGTHRLFGLSWAYHLHLARGKRPEGIWKEVAERTAEHKKLAKRWRNPDGSFSTEFFRGRGNAPDAKLGLNTTGHIFEWLALALSDAELHEGWVEDAASALSLMIVHAQAAPLDGGSLYHAVHGLIIYHHRVYGADKLGRKPPFLPYEVRRAKGP
jgi:hypothetical protein